MVKLTVDDYYEYYDSIRIKSQELTPYYDVDKVKPYAIYIWSKGSNGRNVFDIEEYEVYMYDEKHIIIPEALPIIKELQEMLIKLTDISKEVFI